MDDTKLTILGMIAAFITASITSFLAEPIKSYFENTNKINQVRKALYKELVDTHMSLARHVFGKEIDNKNYVDLIIQGSIQTACFKHTIQNDVTLFYQLDESGIINILYSYLSLMSNPLGLPKLEDGDTEDIDKKYIQMFTTLSDAFIETFAVEAYSHRLDNKLLKKIMIQNDYDAMMLYGKLQSKKKGATKSKSTKQE
jgi:methyltransferase-like protein